MKIIKGILSRPIMLLTGSRYFCYALNFLRGFIIARILGPFYFGIWGAITLLLQYLSFTSLGVENSITVLLSTDSEISNGEERDYSSAAVFIIAAIGIILLLTGYFISSAGVSIIEKYDINKYLIPILGIALFSNVQQILTNIYRVKNNLKKIAFIEVFTATTMLLIVIVYRSNELIDATLIGMIITSLFSILFYCYKIPVKLMFQINILAIKKLIQIGLPLLVYNLSIYLILSSGRTILSVFYSVEELGYYTLANSIAVATLLGLKTIGWSLFPKVLVYLSSEDNLDQLKSTLHRFNQFYSTSVLLVAFMLNMLIPVLLLFLPQYRNASVTITILLFTQAILSIPFGYNALAISRNYQGRVAKNAVIVVLFVIIFCLVTSIFRLKYYFIAISVMIGSLLFAYLQIRVGLKILDKEGSQHKEFQDIFSIWNIISLCLILIGIFMRNPLLWNVAGTVIFLIGNFRILRKIYFFIASKKLEIIQ